MSELTQCPGCNSQWSQSEIEYQQCDTCGYPITDNPTSEYDTEIDDETMD